MIYRVKDTIEGAHPQHPEYPLLPGDLLLEHPDGTFTKVAPGLYVLGFRLTDGERAALEPARAEPGAEG